MPCLSMVKYQRNMDLSKMIDLERRIDMIEVRQLVHRYANADEAQPDALGGVSLSVSPGNMWRSWGATAAGNQL